MSAEDAKKAGSAAYASGDYDLAIEEYSNAIEATTGTSTEDKQFLKLVYSNRSAAYLQKKDNNKALADANKCVEDLDPQWHKGYIRKGDACFALKQWTPAYNAYNRATRLAPEDEGAKSKAEKALACIRWEAERANPTARSAAAGAGGTGYTSGKPVEGTLGHVKGLSSKAVAIMFFMYLLPLSYIPFVGSMIPPSSTCYRIMIGASLLGSVIAMYATHGMPKFSVDYAAQALSSTQAGPLLLALMLLAARPYVLGALPLLLVEINNNMDFFAGQLKAMLPQARALPQAAAYGPQIAQIESMLNNPSGVGHLKNEINKAGCTCEVLNGVYLIIELALPSRSFILAYMWWQYLMMRYLMDQSGHVKIAFSNLDSNITGLTAHKYCPGIVRKGYDLVKGFMVNQIKSKQDEASNRAGGSAADSSSGGGLMGTLRNAASGCTVM